MCAILSKIKVMKKILMEVFALISAIVLASCQTGQRKVCHIHGTVVDERLNGKQIFLVPLENNTAEAVDSVYIRDGQFEIVTDTCHMAQLIMDYHYRDGVQRLLVVTEPGDLNVVIGRVSSASGTPGNDSLEVWKKATENHSNEMGALRRAARDVSKTDSVRAKQLYSRADSAHKAYKKYTRQMAANLKSGALHDFLMSLYPTSYPKRMPDGKIVTVYDE